MQGTEQRNKHAGRRAGYGRGEERKTGASGGHATPQDLPQTIARHAAESFEPCTTRAAMRSRARGEPRSPSVHQTAGRVSTSSTKFLSQHLSLYHICQAHGAPRGARNITPSLRPHGEISAGKYRSHNQHSTHPREDKTK